MPESLADPLKAAFWREWQLATDARSQNELDTAFAHLERAHILAQRRTRLHVRSHVGMLAIGWQRSDRREVLGQLTRIVAAALFSRLWVPSGNTGGANISPLREMPVPPDLAAILQQGRSRAR